jgi:hypothetical protein
MSRATATFCRRMGAHDSARALGRCTGSRERLGCSVSPLFALTVCPPSIGSCFVVAKNAKRGINKTKITRDSERASIVHYTVAPPDLYNTHQLQTLRAHTNVTRGKQRLVSINVY